MLIDAPTDKSHKYETISFVHERASVIKSQQTKRG